MPGAELRFFAIFCKFHKPAARIFAKKFTSEPNIAFLVILD